MAKQIQWNIISWDGKAGRHILDYDFRQGNAQGKRTLQIIVNPIDERTSPN